MIGIRVFCAMPGNPFFPWTFFLSHFAEQTPKATVSFFSTLHVRPAWLKKDNTMMMPKRTMEERAKSFGCDGVAPILSYRNRQYEGKDRGGRKRWMEGRVLFSLGISAEVCSVA